MEGADVTRFSCAACGRKYAREGPMTGTSVKCACGAEIRFPTEEGEDSGELYDVEPEAVELAAGVRPGMGATVEYANPLEVERMVARLTSPASVVRDVIVPVVLLGVSLMGAVVLMQRGTYVRVWGMTLGPTTTGVGVLADAMVWAGLAAWVAPRMGIGFGRPYKTLLKFAAVFIFTDVAMWWLSASLGGGGSGTVIRGVRGGTTLGFFVAMFLSGAGCYYLFDSEDAGRLGMGLAWLSRLINLAVTVLIVLIIQTQHLRAQAVGAAARQAARVKIRTAGMTPVLVDDDQAIAGRVARGSLVCPTGREWKRMYLGKDRGMRELIDALYAAGAEEVYLDLMTGKGLEPTRMYVRLPGDAKGRGACMEVVGEYRRKNGLGGNAATRPVVGKYLSMEVVGVKK